MYYEFEKILDPVLGKRVGPNGLQEISEEKETERGGHVRREIDERWQEGKGNTKRSK